MLLLEAKTMVNMKKIQGITTLTLKECIINYSEIRIFFLEHLKVGINIHKMMKIWRSVFIFFQLKDIAIDIRS